jgi:PAS domain S-box-containing protein
VFIDELVRILALEATKDQVPKQHVESRSELGENSLRKVIKEYHLLRRVIFGVLEEDASLDKETRAVIEDRFDLEIEEAASLYAPLTQQARPKEEAVRQSLEDRHSDFLRAALDAIVLMDSEGKVVEWNPSAVVLFGYPREDALGRSVADLIIPSSFSDSQWRGLIQHLKMGGGLLIGERFELNAIRADGRSLLLELTVAQIPSNVSPLFMGYFRDITERRRLEDDLRNVLSNADCLLWFGEVREDDQAWFHWTTEFFDEAGVKQRIPLTIQEGQTYVGAWHQSRLPEDRERADNEANEALRSGREGYQQEFRHRLRDGRILWFLQRVNIKQMGERHWGLVGVCIDITERKRIEEERNSVLRQASCILWSAEVVRWEDVSGPQLDWSRLQFNEETIHTSLPLDLLPGETYADAYGRCRNYEDSLRMGEVSRRAFLSGEESYRQDFRITDRHGQEHWLHEEVSIQPLDEGRWRAVGVVTEITDRKELELALQERAEALAEADRRKDHFLTMLAHELRNPLAPMLNAAHIIKMTGPQDPRLVRAQEIIERQVRHQASLIDDLLDAARTRQGRIELRPERLDLVRLLSETTELYRSVFEDRSLQLNLDLPDVSVWVRADSTRMTQVMSNLLDNAGKFTPPGGTVTVRLHCNEGNATVFVEDTGIGIEDALLSHVFDTFTQADRSLDRAQGGLGLGLALVKSLMEAHGGLITVESEGIGKGARFEINLPRTTSDVETERVSVPSVSSPPRLRILIIEDNPDAISMLAELLDLFDHEVKSALDGPEGLSRFEEWQPQVILCDLGLPGMDGFEVARQIRQTETRRTYLVALTGYGNEEVRQQAELAGFDGFLTKPSSPDALFDLLKGVTEQGD